MGCDIHVLTEAYNERIGWYNTDDWRINPYFGQDKYEEKYEINPVYTDRNYELFTVLADVRNYHHNIKCICQPKGLPDDMSEETKDYTDKWESNGHSHSWFTIKELYEYWLEMPKTVKRTGILVGDVLKKFDEDGEKPSEWCQGYWGNEKSEQRTWEVEYNPLDEFIKKAIKRFCEIFWVFGVKKEEYKTDEKIKKAIEQYGEKFRVLFFFDN